MPETIPNITNIPAPRVPLVDARTGFPSREWYLFFLNLYTLTGSGSSDITVTDLLKGPPDDLLPATETALLNPLTFPLPTSDDALLALLAPASSPQVPFRQFLANIADYGAVGGGADDMAAFTAAAATGLPVLVPAGTYLAEVTTQTQWETMRGLMGGKLILLCDTLTVSLPETRVTNTAPIDLSIVNSDRLLIEGTLLTRALTGVVSVTGTTGAYAVTATLDDASDIAVNDYVIVKDVSPGIGSPGLLAGRPPAGELRLGFFAADSSEVTVVGTTVTLSDAGAVASDLLAVGDLFIVKGEVRSVATVSGGQTFTIAAALSRDITAGIQYWYHMRSSTGTVTVSGTTMTGVGTAFTTEANIGDLVAFAGYGVRRVTGITNDTSLTLDATIPITVGVSFGFVVTGEHHEGCWLVTNVSGSDVTWTNTNRTAQTQPPVNLVTSAEVVVLKSGIGFTGSVSGFRPQDGNSVVLKDLALIGSGGSTAVGIDLRGRNTDGAAVGQLRGSVGVVGFGYNTWVHGSAYLNAPGAFFCSATTRGLNVTEGGTAELEGATIAGNVGIGMLIGPGSYARFANGRAMANSSDGVRMEVGGMSWQDFAYFCGNGARGLHPVGLVGIHCVGSRINKNTSSGIFGENGLFGRGSGMMALSNANTGITGINGDFEAGQAWLSGNTDGLAATRVQLTLLDGGICWNQTEQMLVVSASKVGCERAHLLGGTYGVRCQDSSLVYGDDVSFGDNTTANILRSLDAQVFFPNATGLTDASAALNHIVVNGEAKIGATAGWVLGGGAVNTGRMATLPASQTGSTLVVPLSGLIPVGATIVSMYVIGQLDSAGNTVTLSADLRKSIATTGGVNDSSVGAITPLSVTADTKVDIANARVSGLTEVVAQDETFYVLFTGTTGATTDIKLLGVAIEFW